MKFLLPLLLVLVFALSACNTLENRRSLYSTQRVHGPYTRELEEGTWGNPKSVDQEFDEGQAQKRYPKMVPGEKKPATSSGSTVVPSSSPDVSLPQ